MKIKLRNLFNKILNKLYIVFIICVGNTVFANPPYQLTIILDKITYQAESVQPHKTENDLWRKYVLYASFQVDGVGWNAPQKNCVVEFYPDPSDRDDWNNVINPKWIGLVGDWYRMNVGGGVRSNLSTNMALLPNGGRFPCAVGVRPSEIGMAPSPLEVAGQTVGGNVYTLRNPPLINEDWMVELLQPSNEKVSVWMSGVKIPGNQIQITFEKSPSKSHMHSSNFIGTKWASRWFRGKEMLEGYAKWPAF